MMRAILQSEMSLPPPWVFGVAFLLVMISCAQNPGPPSDPAVDESEVRDEIANSINEILGRTDRTPWENYSDALERLKSYEGFVDDFPPPKQIFYWIYRASFEEALSLDTENSILAAVDSADQIDFREGTFKTLTEEALNQIVDGNLDIAEQILFLTSEEKDLPYSLERILLAVQYINGSSGYMVGRIAGRENKNLGVTSKMSELMEMGRESHVMRGESLGDLKESIKKSLDSATGSLDLWPYYLFDRIRGFQEDMNWTSYFKQATRTQIHAFLRALRIGSYETLLDIDPEESYFATKGGKSSLLQALSQSHVHVDMLFRKHCPSEPLMEEFYFSLEEEDFASWPALVLYNEARLFHDGEFFGTAAKLSRIALEKAEDSELKSEIQDLALAVKKEQERIDRDRESREPESATAELESALDQIHR